MSSSNGPGPQELAISVVIPAYNSAEWLPSTMEALREAIAESSARFEIIVVDDGSTDRTADVTTAMVEQYPDITVRLIRQSNEGRFMAIYNGAQAASHPVLLVLNSRMLMHRDSLRYLAERVSGDGLGLEWNCHVETDPDGPLVGRFWEVPVMLFWRSYLARPRTIEITAENFDRVPKGTGGLVVRKALFIEACKASWPHGDAHLVSDDTKILRHIVSTSPIVLDPGYSATYRPRVTVRAFLAHAYDRGSLFVDSYAGTTRLRSVILIALAVLPLLAVVALIIAVAVAPLTVPVLLAAMILALSLPAVIAAALGVGSRPLLSYALYVVPFGVYFWAGLLRGLRVHRHLFTSGARPS